MYVKNLMELVTSYNLIEEIRWLCVKLNIKQAINLSLYYSMKYKISTLSESDFEEFYDATKNLCELILNSDKMYLGSVRREFINQVVVATMGKLVYCPTTYL